MLQKNWVFECVIGKTKGRRYKILLATARSVTALDLETGRRVYLSPSSFEGKNPVYITRTRKLAKERLRQAHAQLAFTFKMP